MDVITNHQVGEEDKQFSKIIRILKNEKRKQREAQILLNYFQNYKNFIDFFEKYFADQEESALIRLFQNVKYEKIRKHQFVFKEGDPSNDKYYVIITGQIGVYEQKKSVIEQFNFTKLIEKNVKEEVSQNQKKSSFPKFQSLRTSTKLFHQPSNNQQQQQELSQITEDDTEKIVQEVTRRTIKHQTSFLSNIGLGSNKKDAKKQELLEDLVNIEKEAGNFKVALGAGKGFGEVALTSGKNRTASIVTYEDTQFLIIQRKDFENVRDKLAVLKAEKEQFLIYNVPLLNQINSKATLNTIIFAFDDQIFLKGQTITDEGMTGNRLYYIFNGECLIEFKSILK